MRVSSKARIALGTSSLHGMADKKFANDAASSIAIAASDKVEKENGSANLAREMTGLREQRLLAPASTKFPESGDHCSSGTLKRKGHFRGDLTFRSIFVKLPPKSMEECAVVEDQ